MPSKKVEIIPRGDTALAEGTLGRADRACNAFVAAFKHHDAWPSRAREQWISGTSAPLRHLAELLVRAFDALIAIRGLAARRTFTERLLDYVAQVDAVSTFSRELRRALERLLERRQGPEGVVEAKLRTVSSSMIGMGIETTNHSAGRRGKKR